MDSSSFSLFTVVKLFTSRYALLLDLQIFVNLTTVFAYPVFFRRLLMSLFIFLCSQDLPGSNLFFLSSLFLRNKTLKKKKCFYQVTSERNISWYWFIHNTPYHNTHKSIHIPLTISFTHTRTHTHTHIHTHAPPPHTHAQSVGLLEKIGYKR